MQNYKNSLHSPNALIKRNLIKLTSLNILNLKYRFKIMLFILIPASLIFSTCNKDDENGGMTEIESITSRLVKDINPDSLESSVVWLQGMGTRFALANNHRDIAVKIRNRFERLEFDNCSIDSFMQ